MAVQLSAQGAVIKQAYEAEGSTINNQTGTSYTLALSDNFAIIFMDNASANTVTIPSDASVAFPLGAIVTVTQIGAGQTTITADSGVTLSGEGGSAVAGSTDIQNQHTGAQLVKRAANSWQIYGDISTVA